MARHKRIIVDMPEWVMESNDFCLRSVAEDAYVSQAMAKSFGADKNPSCAALLRAAEKSLNKMADPNSSAGKRCSEGDRAARKFWEAQVCARQTRKALSGARSSHQHRR